jgi:hypothetical protein
VAHEHHRWRTRISARGPEASRADISEKIGSTLGSPLVLLISGRTEAMPGRASLLIIITPIRIRQCRIEPRGADLSNDQEADIEMRVMRRATLLDVTQAHRNECVFLSQSTRGSYGPIYHRTVHGKTHITLHRWNRIRLLHRGPTAAQS